jgi:hypothetical protein
MAFDPSKYLIQLPRRVKDPQTGQWSTRLDDYLQVRDRLRWFREVYPHGTIETEAVRLEWDAGVAIFKATVSDGEGGKATGYGTEMRKSFEDFVEKAETRSLGRALGILGFGTQFCGEELSEGEHVADAPVASALPLPAGEESHPSAPMAETGPTKDQVDHLTELGLAAMGSRESFARSIRITMGLPGDVAITKKLLRTMPRPRSWRPKRTSAMRCGCRWSRMCRTTLRRPVASPLRLPPMSPRMSLRRRRESPQTYRGQTCHLPPHPPTIQPSRNAPSCVQWR